MQPLLPFSGVQGWSFLSRTREAQQTRFSEDPRREADRAYFRENIAGIRTAEDLVADRRLLSVALGAFGLEADINSRFFLRKVLEDGTLSPDALGQKLADKRYLAFSAAFGFGDFAVPRTVLSDFADTVLAKYEDRQFEAAVGDQAPALRMAMDAQRELGTLAAAKGSEAALWYGVLGNPSLRTVVQTAFGLPSSFSQIDIDQQVAALQQKAEAQLGQASVRQFADPAQTERLIRLFLIRDTTGAAAAGTSPAVQLLQGGGSATGILSLLV